jgi:ABC-type sulfate/molybdate transport systems ATPase subunit
MPFSLDIEPVPPPLAARTRTLAGEAGIADESLTKSASDVSAAVRARVHLARAIALAPALLLMEHPTADVPASDRAAFATATARVLDGRAQTALIVTEDREFARRVAHRVLALEPATGELTAQKRGWLW